MLQPTQMSSAILAACGWANQSHAQERAPLSQYIKPSQSALSCALFSEEQNGDQSQAAAPSGPHGGNSLSGSTEGYQTANHSATYQPTYPPASCWKHLSGASRSTRPSRDLLLH